MTAAAKSSSKRCMAATGPRSPSSRSSWRTGSASCSRSSARSRARKVKIVGLTISDSADCSILRLILSHPEQGREILVAEQACRSPRTSCSPPSCPTGPQSLVDLCTALAPGRDQHPLRLSADRPPPRPLGRRHAHRQHRTGQPARSTTWASRSSARPTWLCEPSRETGAAARRPRRRRLLEHVRTT